MAGSSPHLQRCPVLLRVYENRVAHNAVVLEVDYIDEGHAPAVETEHEQVARRFQLGIPPQVGRSDERYLFLAQRPFHRFLPAHVQPAKGFSPHTLMPCLRALLYTARKLLRYMWMLFSEMPRMRR